MCESAKRNKIKDWFRSDKVYEDKCDKIKQDEQSAKKFYESLTEKGKKVYEGMKIEDLRLLHQEKFWSHEYDKNDEKWK